MWIFGYGSLIWKTDFPYKQKIVGYIKGYKRRFYQYSSDHRGTHENPGRVVTLLASNDTEEQVWGIAYELYDTTEIENVLNQLDYREKNGYTRKICPFYPSNDNNKSLDVLVYIGDAENEWYAGEANVQDIAKQIISCKGKSGYNLDYLCKLAESMRQIAPHIYDSHLFEIEREALNLISDKMNSIVT